MDHQQHLLCVSFFFPFPFLDQQMKIEKHNRTKKKKKKANDTIPYFAYTTFTKKRKTSKGKEKGKKKRQFKKYLKKQAALAIALKLTNSLGKTLPLNGTNNTSGTTNDSTTVKSNDVISTTPTVSSVVPTPVNSLYSSTDISAFGTHSSGSNAGGSSSQSSGSSSSFGGRYSSFGLPSDNNVSTSLNISSGSSNPFGLNFNNFSMGKYEERLFIPQDEYSHINFIGLILGPKGINQKRMQAETGCRILLKGKGASKRSGSPVSPFFICSVFCSFLMSLQMVKHFSLYTPEKVKNGAAKLKALIEQATSAQTDTLEIREHNYGDHIDIEIPNSHLGVVIGKAITKQRFFFFEKMIRGEGNIRRIEELTGATVVVSPHNVPNNPNMKMITIQGGTSQMNAARDEIARCVQEMSRYRQKELEKQQKKRPPMTSFFSPSNISSMYQSSPTPTSSSQQQQMHHQQQSHSLETHPSQQYQQHQQHQSQQQQSIHHSQLQSPDIREKELLQTNHHNPESQSIFEPPPIPDPTRFNSGGLPGGQPGLMPRPIQPSLPQYAEEMQPPIRSGDVESGYVEVEIPSDIVGLVIGKSASNVKAMKDRTMCDIRVQRDEDAAPDAKTRLVALRGSVESVKAARNELAKVVHTKTNTNYHTQLGASITQYPQIMYGYPPVQQVYGGYPTQQYQLYQPYSTSIYAQPQTLPTQVTQQSGEGYIPPPPPPPPPGMPPPQNQQLQQISQMSTTATIDPNYQAYYQQYPHYQQYAQMHKLPLNSQGRHIEGLFFPLFFQVICQKIRENTLSDKKKLF
ncbi:hypothetical protein RFI_08197 [Reticulomyxa filosa]|uniref:K Homology domain-containing protein n=1 Tax=Reticulomyxa filosa TaxID=46433 RepID=X6NT68_RETFI|nr:hypothetical protein RFI_08197 [Reticulomyxa filosa]|eukprot:ETO28929.1 hypothetical protein RFI_08197 [Reticulomyxa filosa]